ncbi:TetR/AcrR family transcriptional regulator [Roseibium algae]|uniref:WHG domain-containing protein n=1 Tax=Roseibium algae TaxID=3123038 RepID=A0ABU8TRE1_9HYPH
MTDSKTTPRNTTTRRRDGTLRSCLVEAGITILQKKGTDGLSLRECAALAGVSHAAPGYHFKNLTGLYTAISARGYELFAAAMEARRNEARDSAPKARLLATCEGYLDFAAEHRELFLFMFSGQEIDSGNTHFEAASTRAYEILRETCAPFVHADADPEEIELLVWSLIHGYTHLAMVNKKRQGSISTALPMLPDLLKHLDLNTQNKDPNQA